MILFDDREAGVWAANKLGCVFNPQNSVAISLRNKNKIQACATVYEYLVNSCQVSIVGEGAWAGKDFVTSVMRFCFDQLRVKKVLAFIDSENIRSIRLAEGIGMQKEHVILSAGKVKDLVIYSMTREQCNYV